MSRASGLTITLTFFVLVAVTCWTSPTVCTDVEVAKAPNHRSDPTDYQPNRGNGDKKNDNVGDSSSSSSGGGGGARAQIKINPWWKQIWNRLKYTRLVRLWLPMIGCGLLTMPIVRLVLWKYGYRGDGVSKGTPAARYMKKQRGLIRTDSPYAIAQSIGSSGFGMVRGVMTFLAGASIYGFLYAVLCHPSFMVCLVLLAIGIGMARLYRADPIMSNRARMVLTAAVSCSLMWLAVTGWLRRILSPLSLV